MNRQKPALFNVVLYEPEIPQNTGNIGRLCVAASCRLHLAGKLGFSLTEKALRRAGLDYWPHLDLSIHETFDEISLVVPRENMYFFSRRGTGFLYDIRFKTGDYLVFGCETGGLPDEVIRAFSDRVFRIPMTGDTRSLNLANAVAVAVYEGMRQVKGFGRCV